MRWLTDDLFNDQRYDKTLIPIEEAPMQSGENAVSLGIGLTLRNLDMDAAGNLRVNAWVKATWKDYRLSWEPVEYEGIKKLNLPSDMIWRPDISIYNQDCHIMLGSRTQDANHMNITTFKLTLSGEEKEDERIDMSDFSMNPLDPHLTGGRLDLHKTVRLLPRALY